MLQKFITVGNSIAVTIPKDFARQMNASAGTPVEVTLEPDKSLRLNIADDIRPEKIVDEDVYKAGKDLLKRYLPAFKELAHR